MNERISILREKIKDINNLRFKEAPVLQTLTMFALRVLFFI